MKKLILILLCNFFHQLIAQESPALVYLTTLSEEFGKISENMMSYISAANHGKSARKVEKRRAEVIEQLKESERTVRKMKLFNGDSKLRDSTANYFRISNIVMNYDYGKIMNLEDIAEQSYDAMEAYLKAKEVAGQKIDKALEAANREFTAFATSNNIKLSEGGSKLSQKLKAASEVNEYYNNMYLIFFKSYKNEYYLMEALNADNVSAIEQSRNKMSEDASTDLPKLGPMPGFRGDQKLKSGVQELLKFYIAEADKAKALIDYSMAKEKFDKIKKAFESKSSSQRTQKDIDEYNKAINEINSQSKQANQIHIDLNKRRSYLLKYWNDTSNEFLAKYTPK